MNHGLVQLPITINRGSDVPIQDQLLLAIRELISHGIAKPMMRLPSSRELSQQLSISRNTVKTTYANLISQGYLSSQGTSGTFVAGRLPERLLSAATPNQARHEASTAPETNLRWTIDFAPRGSNPALAPERTWRRLLIKHLPFQARQPAQTDPAGLLALREAAARAIGSLRGMVIDPACCAFVSDDYRALDTVSRTLIQKNDKVVVEDPCDAGLHYLLRSQGVDVISAPVDQHGLRIEDLPRTKVAAVFVTPSHQQPIGVTMSRARRIALLDWANEIGAYVVECDTFGEFSYNYTLVPSLYSLDSSNRVIYINGVSSWISSGTQLCFIVLPPDLTKPFMRVKPFVNPEPNWLEQRVAADFLNSDHLFSHVRRVQQHFRMVRDTILRTMEERCPGHKLTGTDAGRHLVWHLQRPGLRALAVQRRALDVGIRLSTLYDGYCSLHPRRTLYDPDLTLVLGYALLDEERARAAITKLATQIDT